MLAVTTIQQNVAEGPASPELRDYQVTDIARIHAAFEQHRRVCYVLPTGGGKTVIFASITADRTAGNERTVILGHRQAIAPDVLARFVTDALEPRIDRNTLQQLLRREARIHAWLTDRPGEVDQEALP
jgi:superfamily II DNA or RNA helicase